MKSSLRYCFARFAVLLLALHILDVSIDFDFATASSPVAMVEKYDDADSFSELILEHFFNNENLIPESENDDHQHDNHKTTIVHAPLVFYAEQKELIKINPPCKTVPKPVYLLKHSTIHNEDHSPSLYTPPDC